MIKTQIKNGNMSIIVDEGYSYAYLTVVNVLCEIVINDIVSSWSMNKY